MVRKKTEPVSQEEDVLNPVLDDILEPAVDAPAAVAAEDIETVAEPNGRPVGAQPRVEPAADPQPALSAASRRSHNEHLRQEEERIAERNRRQEDAVIIGKYINAEKKKNVLRGKIAGVEVRGEHAFWVIYDGPVTVFIPFHEALPNLPVDVKSDVVRQRQMLSKTIGAEVPFAVEAMESGDGTYMVFGSRRNAVERISKRYFGPDAPNPVKEGDTIPATFLGVGRHAAWLNAAGMDIRLIASQISHRYMENLMDHYEAGDTINLRVQGVAYKNGQVSLTVSALPCELEACISRHNRIRRGNRYVAIMTTHRVMNVVNPTTKRKESYYVASMWLENVEVPAFATVISAKSEGIPHSGERVSVEVDGIARNGYVRCRIIAYLR